MPVQPQRREVPGADAEGVAGLVGHDVDGHVRAPLRVQNTAAEAACADRRPDGVKVRVAVSHDQHVPASGKPPLQQVDGHAGGDGGIALQRLVRAAVVGQPGDAPALERDLVAAALERHVQGSVGCAVALLHAAVDVGDSHGYRQREGVVPHADIHDLSENREIVLHAPVQHLLREQGEILVPVVFPDHAVHRGDPAGQRFLDDVGGRAVVGADELRQLLEVIQHDIRQHDAVPVRLLHEVQVIVDIAEEQEVVGVRLLAEQVRLHAVAAAVRQRDRDRVGAVLRARRERDAVQIRQFPVSGVAQGGEQLFPRDGGAYFRERQVAHRRPRAEDALHGGIDDAHAVVPVDDGVGNIHDRAEHPVDVGGQQLRRPDVPPGAGQPPRERREGHADGQRVYAEKDQSEQGEPGELQVGEQGVQTQQQEALHRAGGKGDAQIDPQRGVRVLPRRARRDVMGGRTHTATPFGWNGKSIAAPAESGGSAAQLSEKGLSGVSPPCPASPSLPPSLSPSLPSPRGGRTRARIAPRMEEIAS